MDERVEALLKFFGVSGASAGLVILCAWLFRESLLRLLDRSMHERLQEQKAELERLSEYLKHSLQREMLRAQLSTTKVHEVYPQLYEHVAAAIGAAFGAIFGSAPSFAEFSRADLDDYLRKQNVVSGMREELLKQFDSSKHAGIREIQKYLRMLETQGRRNRVQEARNYFAIKSLYLTDAVRDQADRTLRLAEHFLIDIEAEIVPEKMPPFEEELVKLRDLMRSEIFPLPPPDVPSPKPAAAPASPPALPPDETLTKK